MKQIALPSIGVLAATVKVTRPAPEADDMAASKVAGQSPLTSEVE